MQLGWKYLGLSALFVLMLACSGACGDSADEDSSSDAGDAGDAETGTTDSGANTETDSDVTIGVSVYGCDSDELELPSNVKSALMSAGFTRCSMPFGVLLAADSQFAESYVRLSAQIVAEMLDSDRDGVADDGLLIAEIQKWNVAWLAMPFDHDRWESEQLPGLQAVLGYDIIIPAWWIGNTSSAEPDTHAKAVMVEEITHFITQFGWSTVYPEQFGVNGWTSVIARETQRAACDWWQHPENDCPNNPAEYPGDCSGPSCDVVEFYQQVLIMRAGMTPGWLGIGFPQSKDALESKLSDEIKAVMDDPQYHQLRTPLGFDYPVLEAS